MQILKFSAATAFVFLTACGSGVNPTTAPLTATDAATAQPSVTLTATPASLNSGQTSVLTWTSTGTTSCTATGGWSASTATSGNQFSNALMADTTFSVVCTAGPNGPTVTASATVAVVNALPTVTLTANPSTVASGGSSTLTWSSTGATACTAAGGWTGNLAASGSQSTGALTSNATYSLTCAGPGGTSTAATATVAVTPAPGSPPVPPVPPVAPAPPAAPVPTATLVATPVSVAAGAVSTLTWTSSNATACTATGGWSGALGVNGAKSTGPVASTTTYSLTCFGSGGVSKSATATVTVTPKTVTPVPTVTLVANPVTVAAGAASTLTWTSTNSTACTASGNWGGTLAANGTKSSGPVATNSSFYLTCTGAGGTSGAASAQVDVVPTAVLTANPSTVTAGAASTLSWTSTNATACTAGGGWSGALAANGTRSTGPVTATTTYSLTCFGSGGVSTIATATVTVTPKTVTPVPTVTLVANPATVAAGAASALTWTSTNATACTAGGGWSGALGVNGTQSTGPVTATTTYSLTCSGPGGNSTIATATVTVMPVTVTPVPTVTLAANPVTVAAGAASTLTWSSTNATACTASGSWLGTLAANGSKSTGPVATNSSFSLTCTGAGGTSGAATVQVNVVPTAVLTANPSVVTAGAASTLSWTSTNATACTASGGWTGALATNGNRSTGAVNATTSYSLTCSGLGGTSAVANATVTVSSNSLTLSPRTAAIVLTQTQQFTATVPGGGTATWMVDGVAGGNAAVGTVSASGLYTAGTSPGQHTVVATSVANTTQSGSATVAVTDLPGVYTYHSDNARDGANTREYALTKTNVTTATFGKVAACPVDGAIYAQPLWASNVVVGGVKHNVVIVATAHDGMFAFDADASPCAKLWQVSLIDTAHGGLAGETPVKCIYTNPRVISSCPVGSGYADMAPEIGVTGTPVIDAGAGIVYVVSKSIISAGGVNTFYQRIHAIDIGSGTEKAGSPALITGTFPGTGDGNGSTMVTFNTQQELQRAGLALLNGVVYVAFTAHEDAAPWYGWMMSYQYTGSGFTQQDVINVSPNRQRGGIWMSGGAPATDADNNIYAITGNGTYNAATQDYSDSLLKLTPTLGVSSYFTPADQANDNAHDLDFSSGGAAILADLPAGTTVTHALICGGKDSYIYVLNRDLLGGDQTNNNNAAAVQVLNTGLRIFATGAFWNNTYYLAGNGGHLYSYPLNTTNVQLSTGPSSQHTYGFAGSTPSITANGPQNGIVWTLDTGKYCTNQSRGCGPVVLVANDASNVATELWNSSLVPADAAGYAVKFTVPTIANGRVYVGTRGNNTGQADGSTSSDGELSIYGLKP